MPFELQIIRAAEFVRIGPHGTLDLQSSKETLATLAQACRKRGLDRSILDLRLLPIPSEPLLTLSQLAELIGTFRDVGFNRSQRLAVLYRIDPHLGARNFAFLGRLDGWQVRAFGDFESALLWLAEEEPEKPFQGQEPAQSIPITQPRPGRARTASLPPDDEMKSPPKLPPRKASPKRR